MEDVNPSQSTDVEQPHHSVNHNRPFFYVQPPSQPYFMYQWPMDPFGQYSFPGPAFPFGRPYVSPYQYMQYPGYVVPHAPMQPTDYRRMTPFIPSVASYDLRFRQHFQQMSVQRETTSSEAQTEAGDPVGKLLHSLGGLQASEEPSPVKDPDAMLASTPVITSHAHEVEKLNHAEGRLESEPVVQPAKVEPEDMARADNFDSAVYDADSSPCCLEELSDVLPLDSSSLHEENQSRGKDDAQHDVEKPCLQRQKLPSDDVCGVPGNGGRSASCSAEVGDSESRVSAVNEKSDSCNAKPPELAERIQDLPLDSAEPLMQGSADYDLSYQILRLPCNKTTTGLVLQKDINPLVYLDSASTLLPPRRYSFGSAYPYSYYPQVAQERQSILSPSLDELSSRDDMFSTDVEDEMMSGHVYVGGSKLAETSGVPTRSAKEHRDDACSACAKTCACCGASLVDEDESVALPERYGEGEVAQELSNHECDCDLEEEALGTCESRNVSSRLYLSRPVLPPTGRQITKHKVRKVQDGADLSDQEQGPVEELHAAAKVDRVKVKGQKGSHPRSYSEHQWRDCQPEHLMDKESWTSSGGKQRSRSCRPTNGLQEKGRPARRRPSCKMFIQQRSRRNEYDDNDEADTSYGQRGRGSIKRRGTRY
ncbi:bucky ball [Electrophorus electricus]|uniref:bucky ball n=1 Tax=Electrophorus electricus TaxID=8005 RepID=UPI0015D01E5E|nr:bucky ball [Electrophorus electricus]